MEIAEDDHSHIMTNFLTWQTFRTYFWHIKLFDVVTYFNVITNFWRPNRRIFDVMTNVLKSWRMTNILTSWRIFNIIMNFWRPDVFLMAWRIFDIMTHFLTSWRTFWRRDVFVTSWRICDVMMDFLMPRWTFWRHGEHFDIMTNFLTSCGNFLHHDDFFDIMTNFLTLWRTFWRNEERFDIMTNFMTLWRIFWSLDYWSQKFIFLNILAYIWTTGFQLFSRIVHMSPLWLNLHLQTFGCHRYPWILCNGPPPPPPGPRNKFCCLHILDFNSKGSYQITSIFDM